MLSFIPIMDDFNYNIFLIEHKGGKIEFDAMTVSDPIEMSDLTSFSFYSHGKLVCMFTADRLFFNKPKDESEN